MDLAQLRIVWDRAVASLHGPLDRHAAPDFAGIAVVAAAGPITVDLAGVTSVDAVGLVLLGSLLARHPTVTLANVPHGHQVLAPAHP